MDKKPSKWAFCSGIVLILFFLVYFSKYGKIRVYNFVRLYNFRIEKST